MKYEYYPKRRTEQERRELNEQILRLLQSEACEQAGVTDEDIFNRYTGDGGLHGLRRSDYDSYNAFSAAKKELENGQFFTPPPLCEMIVSALRLSDTDLVADLTCGMGNFFNFLPNERNAYGCEVDPNACAVARKLYPQAHIVQGDIRDYEPQTHFDFVLGNPPFHLRWVMPDATVMVSHQYYCLKAAKLLKPLGILAVIVPVSFLADSFSDKGAIRMMESRFSFLGQVMLPEHAFSDSGVDDFPTKLQFWQKKSTAADWAPKRYSTDCADIYIPSGHPVMAATALYEKFVMVAKADLAGKRDRPDPVRRGSGRGAGGHRSGRTGSAGIYQRPAQRPAGADAGTQVRQSDLPGRGRYSAAPADRSVRKNRAGDFCGGHQCQCQGV